MRQCRECLAYFKPKVPEDPTEQTCMKCAHLAVPFDLSKLYTASHHEPPRHPFEAFDVKLGRCLELLQKSASLLLRIAGELKDSDGVPIGSLFVQDAMTLVTEVNREISPVSGTVRITRLPGETDAELRNRIGIPPITTPFLDAIKHE